MEEYYANIRVRLNEALEVTWIRQLKIDAIKQSTRSRSSNHSLVSAYSLSPSYKMKNQYIERITSESG